MGTCLLMKQPKKGVRRMKIDKVIAYRCEDPAPLKAIGEQKRFYYLCPYCYAEDKRRTRGTVVIEKSEYTPWQDYSCRSCNSPIGRNVMYVHR